jgi:hypothetical protein
MIADEPQGWRAKFVSVGDEFSRAQIAILAAQCGLPPDTEDQDDIPDIFEMCWADDPETSEFS